MRPTYLINPAAKDGILLASSQEQWMWTPLQSSMSPHSESQSIILHLHYFVEKNNISNDKNSTYYESHKKSQPEAGSSHNKTECIIVISFLSFFTSNSANRILFEISQ